MFRDPGQRTVSLSSSLFAELGQLEVNNKVMCQMLKKFLIYFKIPLILVLLGAQMSRSQQKSKGNNFRNK